MAARRKIPEATAADDRLLETGRLVKLVFTSLLRHVDARMQPMELTAMQWEPLLLLALGRADTVAGLARECRVDCGAMTRMLDRLEQKQLLQRQRNEIDRRVVNLSLTEKGREVALQIPQVVREELQSHLRDFSEQEVHMLNRLLARMVDNGAGAARAQEECA
jgi:DNA-binding MarR family transcriptional regulator